MTPPRAQQYDFAATVLAGTVALLFPEYAERLAALDKVVKADRALSGAYDEAEALLRGKDAP